MNFYFIYPKFLYLLLLIPVIIVLYFLSSFYGKKKAMLFSNFEALERISGIEFFSKSFVVLFLDIVLVILLVFSLAQLHINYTAPTDSFSHVILLDSSRSMSVNDLGDTRMNIAKKAAKAFLDALPSNVEFGVVSFAGESKIIKGIDRSNMLTKSAIDSIDYLNIEGTNIINSILIADSLYFRGQRKSILLISDGEFSVGDLKDILKYSKDNEITINTILIGTVDGARDNVGALHKINSDFMMGLSFNTGGKYFEISSSSIPSNFSEVFIESQRNIDLDTTFYLILSTLLIFFISWFINNFRIKMVP
jgi:Ca-activated chloride channel homolog